MWDLIINRYSKTEKKAVVMNVLAAYRECYNEYILYANEGQIKAADAVQTELIQCINDGDYLALNPYRLSKFYRDILDAYISLSTQAKRLKEHAYKLAMWRRTIRDALTELLALESMIKSNAEIMKYMPYIPDYMAGMSVDELCNSINSYDDYSAAYDDIRAHIESYAELISAAKTAQEEAAETMQSIDDLISSFREERKQEEIKKEETTKGMAELFLRFKQRQYKDTEEAKKRAAKKKEAEEKAREYERMTMLYYASKANDTTDKDNH